MERWNPLMEIFVKSPSPEGEASQWMLQQSSSLFAAFLALLLGAPLSPSVSSHSCMWIQTLPNVVQTRILSFLAIESHRLCPRLLHQLASNILGTGYLLDFWVERAARNLLSIVSAGADSSTSCSLQLEEEFHAIPHWLENMVTYDSLLPWLPPEFHSQNSLVSVSNKGEEVRPLGHFGNYEEEKEAEEHSNLSTGSAGIESEHDSALVPEIQFKATELKSRLLELESAAKSVPLAEEIRQLCTCAGENSFVVLGFVEPWEAEDEIISVLLTHLVDGTEEFPWSAHVLASSVLPKFLILQSPAPRILSTATINYCKSHQRAAVDGFLLPLVLRKEGLNSAICDIIARIIKECLHPAHVSAFCQRLLCNKKEVERFLCLPCHRSLISDELVWTEALFTLFQSILNQNIYLTQDSVDRIAYVLDEMADKFSKSLKFSNFLLSLVRKCGPSIYSHKFLLKNVAERTDTFITKSVLSKLNTL
ncbi:hypothetical protein H6P81_000237 [Aristolochia fimbriata]|uniref:Fanconi Anaemia group E protein C-terminal domain-containing protein n=1 Tax=Aristolochia fimbriata TaxID=158543 RepID=A0AAV7F495_ARIFI|nr:hypothetical protein H6P81_000237 [Aristolochia fimbriata]